MNQRKENLKIGFASLEDYEFLLQHDKHIAKDFLKHRILEKQIILLKIDGNPIAWLRYGFFWDNIPFLNMLYVLEEYRNKGYGQILVQFWENEMRKDSYEMVLTSTLSNEKAQFFYRKNGYLDCGGLLLPKEPLEIFFYHKL